MPNLTGTRQTKKAATRARILVVARSHFERDGFEGASVRDIGAEAGVAAGTVLLHFGDKLGLLHASLHDDLERAISDSLSTASRGRLLHRLCSVIQPFFEYYAARPSLSRTLLRESLLAKSPWRERFSSQVVRVNDHVIGLIEEAKARGEVSPDAAAPLLATALFSFYYLALIGWVQEGVENPALLFKALLKQHLRAYSLPRQ